MNGLELCPLCGSEVSSVETVDVYVGGGFAMPRITLDVECKCGVRFWAYGVVQHVRDKWNRRSVKTPDASSFKSAKRWGYDSSASRFNIEMSDTIPVGEYEFIGYSKSVDEFVTVDPPVTQTCGPSEVIAVDIHANPGDIVRVEIFFGGELVDSPWVECRIDECPSCGYELGQSE